MQEIKTNLILVLSLQNHQQGLIYYLFDEISSTSNFCIFGRILVNLYQVYPANLLDTISKARGLNVLKRKHFGDALSASHVNSKLLMERGYLSGDTEIRTLLFSIPKNHIEIGYIFALQQLRNWDINENDT